MALRSFDSVITLIQDVDKYHRIYLSSFMRNFDDFFESNSFDKEVLPVLRYSENFVIFN